MVFVFSCSAYLGLRKFQPSCNIFSRRSSDFFCEVKPLTRDSLQSPLANRERFAKACLACLEDTCAMRIQPAGDKERETLYRNTYCLPKKVRKMTFTEGYNMTYRF